MTSREDPDGLFEYASFLASSARGALEEGTYTASLRLADAIRRLDLIVPDTEGNPALDRAREMLATGLEKAYFADRDTYIAFLDELVAVFATEARRRHKLEG